MAGHQLDSWTAKRSAFLRVSPSVTCGFPMSCKRTTPQGMTKRFETDRESVGWGFSTGDYKGWRSAIGAIEPNQAWQSNYLVFSVGGMSRSARSWLTNATQKRLEISQVFHTVFSRSHYFVYALSMSDCRALTLFSCLIFVNVARHQVLPGEVDIGDPD